MNPTPFGICVSTNPGPSKAWLARRWLIESPPGTKPPTRIPVASLMPTRAATRAPTPLVLTRAPTRTPSKPTGNSEVGSNGCPAAAVADQAFARWTARCDMNVNSFIGRPSASLYEQAPPGDFDGFGTQTVSLTEAGRTKICLLKHEPCRQAIKETGNLYQDCADDVGADEIFLPLVARVLTKAADTCKDDPPLDGLSGVVVQMNVLAAWGKISRPEFNGVPIYFIEEFEKDLATLLGRSSDVVHVTNVTDVDEAVWASLCDGTYKSESGFPPIFVMSPDASHCALVAAGVGQPPGQR